MEARNSHGRPESSHSAASGSTPTQVEENQVSGHSGTELHRYSIETHSFISPTSNNPITFLKALYKRKIAIHVAFRDHRNHLANERTFLAWFRTSVLLSMLGILTTQLFHLQPAKVGRWGMNFFMLGSPLGAVCHAAAMFNILFGAHKFWRHQCAMVEGKAVAGGWELVLAGTMITLITIIFLIFILLCDTDQAPG